MSQAIQVHYRPNTRTARAFCFSGSLALPVDDFETADALFVAQALQTKIGWTGSLTGGRLPNGDFVFVQQERK